MKRKEKWFKRQWNLASSLWPLAARNLQPANSAVRRNHFITWSATCLHVSETAIPKNVINPTYWHRCHRDIGILESSCIDPLVFEVLEWSFQRYGQESVDLIMGRIYYLSKSDTMRIRVNRGVYRSPGVNSSLQFIFPAEVRHLGPQICVLTIYCAAWELGRSPFSDIGKRDPSKIFKRVRWKYTTGYWQTSQMNSSTMLLAKFQETRPSKSWKYLASEGIVPLLLAWGAPYKSWIAWHGFSKNCGISFVSKLIRDWIWDSPNRLSHEKSYHAQKTKLLAKTSAMLRSMEI
jgi:hypothetical protein